MANLIYLTLKGKTQGLISLGCSTANSIGNRFQNGHEDKIQVISLNHIMTREQHVIHHPVAFTKPIDKSHRYSVLLSQTMNCLMQSFLCTEQMHLV